MEEGSELICNGDIMFREQQKGWMHRFMYSSPNYSRDSGGLVVVRMMLG
jgi:hypothetical protein